MEAQDPRHVRALLQLAEADDDQFRAALTTYLTRNRSAALAGVFRDPALRLRTVRTLSWLLRQADRRDRPGQPDEVRTHWQALRAAALDEKRTIAGLVDDAPRDASPRGRALRRLAGEHQAEWTQMVEDAGGNPRKVSLRRLAARHPERMSALLRAERDLDAG